MMNEQIKLVLFDLGGVLVELGAELFPSSWISGGQTFGLDEWFKSQAAIDFETGLVSGSEFISELKQSLSLKVASHDILAAFAAWPQGLSEGSDELLERLKVDYRVAVLSNSNEIHEPILLHEFGLASQVDDIFFSHLIGYSKPNLEAYNYVLNALNVQANEVIFFDDNEANVHAAKKLGMKAYQMFSPGGVAKFI